jgi:hypothetical protein
MVLSFCRLVVWLSGVLVYPTVGGNTNRDLASASCC